MSDATWLPNLVGGTSIWKLAVDLNEAKFFDGRLLVPETEGSESLPVTVRWDLTGLVPLKEARASHPEAVAAAAAEFQACLERVAKVFATPNSGFDKYKDAFTVPSLDADGGANYFYSPERKKLFVINWGASPRSMGGKAEYVFGYEDWSKSWGNIGALSPASAGALEAAGTGAAAAAVGAAAAVAASKDENDANAKKKGDKPRDDQARPWWVWPLFGLVAIALVLLALLLFRACEDKRLAGLTDAGAEGGTDAAAALDGGPGAGALADAGADAAANGEDGGGGDASADAAAASDAGAGDGGADGGRRKDGGLAENGDDEDDDDATGVGSSGGGTGRVIVTIGPGGGTKTSVHRKHYQDEAVTWRVTQGANKVSRTEQAGHRYDVWLVPGQSFEGVRVEWQDKAGKWHPH